VVDEFEDDWIYSTCCCYYYCWGKLHHT